MNTHALRLRVLLLGLLLLTIAAAGQAATAPPQEFTPPPSAQALAPGDLISVSVFQAPELTTEARLAPDGTFRMPEAGTVSLAGQTAAQAAATLAARLRQNYLLHPEVEVLVRAFAAQPVTVLGAVAAPGVYSARTYPDLGAMLAAAGGLKSPTGERVLVERHGGAPVTLPAAALARGRAASSLPLHAGDTVQVVPAATVYVGGDVAKPGAFVLPASGLTLLEALTLAGGARRDSRAAQTRIVHRSLDGSTRIQWVDARPIMKGWAADPELHAFDLVYVPESLGKAAWFAGLKTVTATASAIVSGVIIFH
ncbi:MAG: polysaccharide biosynthesis/export family protein [Terriglobales bacterium]